MEEKVWPEGPGRCKFFRKVSEEVQKSLEECARELEGLKAKQKHKTVKGVEGAF